MSILNRRLHKLSYYIKSSLLELYPNFLRRSSLKSKINKKFSQQENEYIKKRVDYYNKLTSSKIIHPKSTSSNVLMKVGSFRKTGSSVYYFDLAPLIRHFPEHYWFYFLPGDITTIPSKPTLLKSRPINENNQNSILLKLNSVRHYYYEKDPFSFSEKLPLIVWRGADFQSHRQEFLDRYYNSPFVNVGSTGNEKSNYKKEFMTITEQCQYKYIISIEGNDVATNLKWILKSNSICFMRKPRFETWFMEGQLKPNVHYIELRDDFSDLEEKFKFCEENPDLMENIIHNANQYAKQFDNKNRESLIALLVLNKYFELTNKH